MEIGCNLNGVIKGKRCEFAGNLKNASADLRQFVAARVRFAHLGVATLIGHVKAAGLLFLAHLLPRQSTGKDRHGKHKQSYPNANQLAEVQHMPILDHFRLCHPINRWGPARQNKKRGSISLPRFGGSLFGAHRSGIGECASLSFTAPTPGHFLQRFQKVDKLPVRKRPKDPGVIGANKAPAIWDKAVHRLSDTRMEVSAGINPVVLGKTGNVPDL
jgi:hypothetical protein